MKVLKFSASWCKPCSVLSQNISSVDLPVEVEEVDIDTDDPRVRKFGIRGVPTMIKVDDNGKELSRAVGVMSPKKILEWLE